MIDLSIDDGIATIIWNVADRPMNVLNDASIAAFESAVRKLIADPSLSWEEKRPLWHFLYNTGRDNVLMECMREGLENKTRVPFEGAQGPAGVGVPEDRRVVKGPRQGALAVRAQRHGIDPVGMSVEGQEGLAAVQVPEDGGLVH